MNTTPQLPRPDFCILGPLRVYRDGVEVRVAARRQRALLQLLLLNVGRVVPAERLIDQLWDGAPPPQAAVTLRSYVSAVRQALGGRDEVGRALVTRGQGYALDVPPESVDAVQLRLLADRGREHLRNDEVQQGLAAFDAAVALWAGDPLAEIADHEVAQGAVAELTETYLGALEGRFEALLAHGRHADAIASLEAFVREQPLREGPTALLMLALYRAGRAPDALAVHRQFRRLLREELGIDPSARVEQLLGWILAQDPRLDVPPRLREAPVTPLASPTTRAPVEAAVGSSSSLSAPLADIVGRTREMSVMESRLDVLVSRATGSMLLLAGEPGVGKTTLLEALATRARERGVAVHRGRSPAATGGPPFWLWSQVIEALAARLTDDELRQAVAGAARPVAQLSHVVAERAGHPLPLTGDDAQALRFLLYEGVSIFIDRATGGRPTVITLDDIHWADIPSLELLSYVTPSLAGRALLLVAAYRDLPADRSEALEATLATVSRDDTADELAVTGLDHDEVASLARALSLVPADEEPAEAFVTALHQRTAGNPFFVRQLARHMSETAAEGTDPGTAPVPAGVQHVIASRLRRLSAPTTDLLAGAAVVGREFDLRTAAAAAALEVEEALDGLDEAIRHGLVEPAGDDGVQARFTHALVHEVVLDQVPAGRATRLHARVAEHLASSGSSSVDQLAEHLWASRAIAGASAVPAQLIAADAAAAVFAHERSEMYLRRALHLVERFDATDSHAEITVLLSLFRLITSVRGWGSEDARELVERARELSGASAVRDDAVRLWWSVFFFLLDRDDAASYTQVARTLLSALERPDNPAESSETSPHHATRAAIDLMNTYADLAEDQREAAERHLQAARGHVEAARPAELAAYDENLHVMLLVIEAGWAALTGDAAKHESSTNAAIALADADGRPFPRAVARTLGASTAVYLSPPAGMLEIATEAHELSSRFRFGWLASLAEAIHKWAATCIGGDAADAIVVISALLRDLDRQGHHGSGSWLRLILADVYAVSGQTTAARDTLTTLRHRPGPYRCLVVDLVDRRLSALH
ncbi:MAG TPA: BTAD domain-containing putative transcriptional regulator [Nocardioidaceae bacterium]|nr:BTAD domain-containing putative transcriptional regulator [Nocardioidaceae bacterium]